MTEVNDSVQLTYHERILISNALHVYIYRLEELNPADTGLSNLITAEAYEKVCSKTLEEAKELLQKFKEW